MKQIQDGADSFCKAKHADTFNALLSEINYSSIKFVPNCHPEKTKNQAVKQRRFCFVQDLIDYKSYFLIGKMLKYA